MRNLNLLNKKLLNRKPRILFDMDDVLAEYLEALFEDFNKDYKTSFTVKDVKCWELKNTFGDEIIKYLSPKGRFRNLKVKNNADKYLKEIIDSDRYDVYIVTATSGQGYDEKIEWLKEHMPFFDTKKVVPAVKKSAIWGDILVDDRVANLIDFEEKSILNCKGILYQMDYTKDEDFLKINDLSGLLSILDNMFYFK